MQLAIRAAHRSRSSSTARARNNQGRRQESRFHETRDRNATQRESVGSKINRAVTRQSPCLGNPFSAAALVWVSNRTWCLVITLTVGLVARQTIREPYSTPFFDLFFSDTLHMKAWLVTAAVILACSQLLTAARIYEVLRFPPNGRFYHSAHRWSGRAAILLTLPVAGALLFSILLGLWLTSALWFFTAPPSVT